METTEKSSASGQGPENSGKDEEEGKENVCCYCGSMEAFWSSIPCKPDHSHSKEEVEEQQKEKPEEETGLPENVESKEETPAVPEERTEEAVPEMRTEEEVPEEGTEEAVPDVRTAGERALDAAREAYARVLAEEPQVPEERTGAENPEERVEVSVPEEQTEARSKGQTEGAEEGSRAVPVRRKYQYELRERREVDYFEREKR